MSPAVVVVNYGSADLLARNFAGLDLAARLVVVDNLSTAAERTAVGSLAADRGWSLVSLPDNRGFGAGVNAGVRHARLHGADRFVVVNPDAVLTEPVLAGLDAALVANPWTVVSPRVVTSSGADFFAGSELDLVSGHVRRTEGEVRAGAVPWLSGACLGFSADVFDAAGGFAESYFLYWEDVDFSVACAQAGARLELRDDLVVMHDEGGTQQRRSTRAKSDLYYRYNCRNRLLFGARHLSRRRLLGWMLRTPAESWQILLRGGRRQLLQSPRPLWATLSGSARGLGLACRALLRPPPGTPLDGPRRPTSSPGE